MAKTTVRSDACDAMRGIAILLVLSFHWFGLPFGWTGVDLFFVLSGYLIGGILIDNRSSPLYFRTFYARRVIRIVPLYLLFLIMVAWSSGISLPIWRFLTFTQNFAWVHTGLVNVGLEGLTWSLAVEEQFYLILPLMVRTLPNRALLFVSASLVVSAPLCRWLLIVSVGGISPYVLLPGRMDTLFAGVVIACVVRQSSLWGWVQTHIRLLQCASVSAFGGFIALASVIGFSPGSRAMHLLGYSLVAAAYGCGLLTVVAYDDRPFRHKLLCAVGVGAYAIYLFHQIVLVEVYRLLIPTEMHAGPGRKIEASVVALIGVLCLTLMSWFLIERPLIRYAKVRWQYGELRSLAA
jgi:peptidoglycan/LPS O-acetylase OafA/YrhL